MKLFLVRHGETEENAAGIVMGHHHGVLTEKGKAQARATAEILKDKKFDHIYSSDLARCVDTAEIIKEYHPDTPLTFTKELRERNLGIFQGQKSETIDWDSYIHDMDKQPEGGGESLNELNARGFGFIKKLYDQYPNDTLLLVSHNGWLKGVIGYFQGIHPKDVPKVENAEVIEIEVGPDLSGKVSRNSNS